MSGFIETEIKFVQTADPDSYYELFITTASVNRLFCRLHRIQYEGFLGIKVGRHPWHATFNRIFLLKELLDEGYRGWVIYLDADALVADVTFDIRRFLAEYSGKALLAAPGGVSFSEVNAGILFFNYAHETARIVIERWFQRFQSDVDVERLNRAVSPWHEGIIDDQALLHRVLGEMDATELFLEHLPLSLVGNHDSTFLRQLLRTYGSLADRVEAAEAQVSVILAEYNETTEGPARKVLPQANVSESKVAARNEPVSIQSQSNLTHLAQLNLTDLANRHFSDKGSRFGSKHRYAEIYDLAFFHFRTSRLKILELGLAPGGPEVGGPIDRTVASPSLSVWLEYFPHGEIVGFDISDFSHLEAGRFKFQRGDCGVEADLISLAGAHDHFDVIIDDASHASYHQQLAFKFLFPKLTSGGIYAIESTHWQPPHYESTLPHAPKTLDLFNAYFTRLEFLPGAALTENDLSGIGQDIYSYTAIPNMNKGEETSGDKLILIRKR